MVGSKRECQLAKWVGLWSKRERVANAVGKWVDRTMIWVYLE